VLPHHQGQGIGAVMNNRLMDKKNEGERQNENTDT
jgi:hypothetical protein